MIKSRVLGQWKRSVGVPALIVSAAAAAIIARSMLPELVRYLRIKSM